MKAWREAQVLRIGMWEQRPGKPFRAYKTDKGIWIIWDRIGSMHSVLTLPEVMDWAHAGGDRS